PSARAVVAGHRVEARHALADLRAALEYPGDTAFLRTARSGLSVSPFLQGTLIPTLRARSRGSHCETPRMSTVTPWTKRVRSRRPVGTGKQTRTALARHSGFKVDMTVGDMASASAPRDNYPLVYLIFNATYNLLTQDGQVRCFEN